MRCTDNDWCRNHDLHDQDRLTTLFDITHGTRLLRLLSEPTRLRLLMLLRNDSLTVTELTVATDLAQSRVSTHLGRLREAGLVQEQRIAGKGRLTVDPGTFDQHTARLLRTLLDGFDDNILRQDQERAAEIVRRRSAGPSWVESAAGRMEREYSPGRTWEATARALLGLMHLGDVLDIASGDGVLAEILGDHARSITCLDRSETVLEAARQRLHNRANVTFRLGDMHALPFSTESFDQAFVLHALTYTQQPRAVVAEAVRVLRPGGTLILVTLAPHQHRATVAAFDHVNLGIPTAELNAWSDACDLQSRVCEISSRETRPPYFEVATLIADKPT